MSVTVVESHEMPIDSEDDIILVRRNVRDLAQTCGFDVFAARPALGAADVAPLVAHLLTWKSS